MADINQVVLVGRLVRDAQMKYTNSGLAICEFAVAINNRRKQGDEWVDEAHFFDVTLFGRQGEAIQQYLTQGKQVGINGRLKQDRWETTEGQKRSKVGVIADNVMLLGGSGGAGGTGRPGPDGGAARPERAPAGPQSGGYSGGDDFPDGIPF